MSMARQHGTSKFETMEEGIQDWVCWGSVSQVPNTNIRRNNDAKDPDPS